MKGILSTNRNRSRRKKNHTSVSCSFQYPAPKQYHSTTFFFFPWIVKWSSGLSIASWSASFVLSRIWREMEGIKKKKDKGKGKKKEKGGGKEILTGDMIDAVCALSFTAYVIYTWEIVSLIVKETKSLSRIKYIRDTEQFFIWFGYHSLSSLLAVSWENS